MGRKNKSSHLSTERGMDRSRRAAIGGVVIAGLTGQQWMKPVVESVVLPAHAQATDQQFFADITPDAPLEVVSALLCITVSGSFYVGRLAMTFANGEVDVFSNPAVELGTDTIMTGTCGPGGTFRADNMTANTIDYGFVAGSVTGTIPRGSCSLPSANCTSLVTSTSPELSGSPRKGW